MRDYDLIRRADVLQAATTSEPYDGFALYPPKHDTLLERIKNIPACVVDSVCHGHWVGIDDYPYESWECDRCGCVVENTDDPWNYFHYCPNCGAKMEVSEDADN